MNDREAQLEAKVFLLEEQLAFSKMQTRETLESLRRQSERAEKAEATVQEMALTMLSMDSEWMELSRENHERMTRLDAVIALCEPDDETAWSDGELALARMVRAAAAGEDQ